MATRIRLTRCGRRNLAYYRIVVADQRKQRDGRFIEIIGHYQPVETPPRLEIDEARALDWLLKGALPSDTVKSLFRQKGILEKFHTLRYGKKTQAAS